MSNKCKSISKSISKAEKDAIKMTKEGLEVFEEVSKNLVIVGKCKCGEPLYHYLTNIENNLFNIYCLDCGSVSDIRFPKDGDLYYKDDNGKVISENNIEMLSNLYKEFHGEEKQKIFDEAVKTMPKSIMANDNHGDFY